MAGELLHAGLRLAPSPEKADVILVNTCAFIESAREEAADQILWACERKAKGACRAVVVSGCLPQRYADKMHEAFPDIDAILGVDDLDKLPEIVKQIINNDCNSNYKEKQSSKTETAKKVKKIGVSSSFFTNGVSSGTPCRVFDPKEPGLILSGGPFAYLKIAEGCFHACAFCAIPGIRGKFRSRSIDAILDEARGILDAGIHEINLVAQDVTGFGKDIPKGPRLPDLLKELDKLEGDFKIRLLYGYPATVTDELLEWMVTSPHACRYLDIPIQHSDPDILRAMRRAETVSAVEGFVKKAREKVPGITLRTTVLVGFPGETEEHFKHLLNYIKDSEFDHLGVFPFYPEEGTAAFEMGDDPDAETGNVRADKVMAVQKKISTNRLKALVGTRGEVILEAPSEENGPDVWIGRSTSQAPDGIDGSTYIFGVPENAEPGSWIPVTFTGVDEYDLLAEYLG